MVDDGQDKVSLGSLLSEKTFFFLFLPPYPGVYVLPIPSVYIGPSYRIHYKTWLKKGDM